MLNLFDLFLESNISSIHQMNLTVPLEVANLPQLKTLILARNHLVGRIARGLCERNMEFIAADCDELRCPCCDLCCTDGQRCTST